MPLYLGLILASSFPMHEIRVLAIDHFDDSSPKNPNEYFTSTTNSNSSLYADEHMKAKRDLLSMG